MLFAAVYLVTGHRYDGVRVTNCLLAGLCVYLTYRLGKRVFNGRIGLLAAAAYSIYPVAIVQSADMLSEPLGILLFLAFLEAALCFAANPRWPLAALTGMLFGLALLSRANYIVMFPLLIVWLAWQLRASWLGLAQGAMVLATAAAVMRRGGYGTTMCSER